MTFIKNNTYDVNKNNYDMSKFLISDAMIEKAFSNNTKGEVIRQLYNGSNDAVAKYRSPIEADTALIDYLVWYFGKDKQESIKNIFKKSKLYKPDKDEVYIDNIIIQAVTECKLTRLEWITQNKQNNKPEIAYVNTTTNTSEPNNISSSGVLPFCFWAAKSNNQGNVEVIIKHNALCEFLQTMGFFNTTIFNTKKIIRINNNIVDEVDIGDIRRILMNDFLEMLPSQIVTNKNNETENYYFSRTLLAEKLRQGINFYISEAKLQSLKHIKINFYKDTLDTTAFFYKNGFVEVTAQGKTLKPYSDMNGAIWRKTIINFDIDLNSQSESDYMRFLINVCTNPDTNILDINRYNALITVHGYILNRYNNPSYPKTIIFSDGNLSDNPNGGTGKSLIAGAIGRIRKRTFIDGKKIDVKGQFAFQGIDFDTQIVQFDDVPKNFRFEDLFSATTEGYYTEKKYQNAIQFTKEDNPKTIITTNFAVKGEGVSYERRKFELELFSYYNADRTPEDDFGIMFDLWSNSQWNSFYNFMFTCSYNYHLNGNTMLSYKSETLELKKLKVGIGSGFIDFADSLPRNVELNAQNTITSFKMGLSRQEQDHINNTNFGNKLATYCKYNNIALEKKLTGSGYSKQMVYILRPSEVDHELILNNNSAAEIKEPQLIKNTLSEAEIQKVSNFHETHCKVCQISDVCNTPTVITKNSENELVCGYFVSAVEANDYGYSVGNDNIESAELEDYDQEYPDDSEPDDSVYDDDANAYIDIDPDDYSEPSDY